jgi:geranylgeranyl pyrophosphate synthase
MSARERRAELDAWLSGTRAWVEAELERALASLEGAPAVLLEAMRYSLLGGGKRLRPALVRLGCALVEGEDARALAPAAAVELIHTYSLVHDDLPCMDDDDLRRGRPTCHKVYGEAVAVLVGDGLQALAFEWLARGGNEHAAEMTAVLARASGPLGMVGGQALDLVANARETSVAEVRAIHASKTAALISAALELGGLAGGATAAERERLRELGLRLGAAFQAVDDLLDVTGDAASLGKTPGKDHAHDKATLVAALGLDGARVEAGRLTADAERSLGHFGGGAAELARALAASLLERRS